MIKKVTSERRIWGNIVVSRDARRHRYLQQLGEYSRMQFRTPIPIDNKNPIDNKKSPVENPWLAPFLRRDLSRDSGEEQQESKRDVRTVSRSPVANYPMPRYATSLEPLEQRVMLAGDPFQATITILIGGNEVEIPENIGVDASGPISEVRTEQVGGTLTIATLDGNTGPDGDVTVGNFFDTWQNEAGLAGNNADADFSSTEVLNHFTNEANTIRMWVNGIRDFDFENYVIAADDDILISFARDVRLTMETNLDSPNGGDITMELFSGVTPVTVANILGYANRDDYEDVYFHRLAKDFVVQGGGFSTPTTNVDDANFSITKIPTQDPIVNEPRLSNVKDTLSVAKLGGDPDSGTSQFFWSQRDNSANLDNQNGGFTVFGQVDSSGSEVFEAINNLRSPTDIAIAAGMTSLAELEASPLFSDGFKSLFSNASNDAPIIEKDGEQHVVNFESFEGDGFVLGTKFFDLNRDGVFDDNESGMEDWTIFIDENDDGVLNPGEKSTQTDRNGDYAFRLPVGTHVIREVFEAGFTQTLPLSPVVNRYEVEITEIAEEFVDLDFANFFSAAPQSIDLNASSDTGYDSTDNITRLNNESVNDVLTFTVDGVESGFTVQLLADGVVVNETAAIGSTITVATDGTSTLHDGVHEFTARLVSGDLVGGESPALEVTIDSVSPGFESTPPTEVVFPDTYVYNAETSEEGSGLIYSLPTAPDGMSIDAASGEVSWSPTIDQVGDHPIEVTATDAAGNTADQLLTVRVQATPNIDEIPNQTINAGESLSIPFHFTDANLPDDTITVTLGSGAAAGASVNGTFTWTPSQQQGFGEFPFTVRVTDQAGLFDETTFSVTVNEVNQPPTIDLISDQTVEMGNTLTFGIVASDPNESSVLTFDFIGDDLGASIDTAGQFTWTPTDSQKNQIHDFTIAVSDGELMDQDSFQITVVGENLAPAIDAIAPIQIDEGELATFTATATDPNGVLDSQSFRLGGNVPDGASIDSVSGEFRWTPTEDQGPGEFSLEVIVADQLDLIDSTFVTITVDEVNQPPDLQPIGDQSVVAGSLLSLIPTVNDPDLPANNQTFSLEPGAPAGAAVDLITGRFTFTPDENLQETTFTASLRVEDDGGLSDVETFQINVSVLPKAPTISPLNDQLVDEGATLTLMPTVTDPNLPNDVLTFSLDQAPMGATIDPQTGTIEWTPTEAQGPGVFTLDVIVTDQSNLTGSTSVTVTVDEVNQPPDLQPIEEQSIIAGSLLSLIPTVNDPDLPANNQTFSLEPGAPTGAAVDPTTGRFTFTPEENLQEVSFKASLRVEDAGGLSDVETFYIHVVDLPQAPTVSALNDQQVDEESTLTLIPTVIDPDLPSDVFTFSLDQAPPGATIDPQTGEIDWTPTEAQGPGDFEITVRATDSAGLFGTSTFRVTVAEVNAPPKLEAVQEQSAFSETEFVITLDAFDPDSSVARLSYALIDAGDTGATIDSETGVFRWIPETNHEGLNEFVITVEDEFQLSSMITLTVDVNLPVNIPFLFNREVDGPAQELSFFSPPSVTEIAPVERTIPRTTSSLTGPHVNSLILPTFGDETGSGGDISKVEGEQKSDSDAPSDSDEEPTAPSSVEKNDMEAEKSKATIDGLDIAPGEDEAEAVDQVMRELFTDGVVVE